MDAGSVKRSTVDEEDNRIQNINNELGSSKETTTQEESKEGIQYITGVKLLVLDASVTLVAFLILLDTSIIGTAVPQITSDFRSLPDVGWYAGSYPLANAALQPITGKLYTYFRSKYVFMIFLFIFEVGSLICGAAQTSSMFIAGRVIAGLGASGIMNGAMTIIAGCTPLEKRPLHVGIMLGIASLGLVTGPLIGGALTEHATWRWCFYINLPIGAVAAVLLMLIFIPDITKKEPLTMALVRKIIPELDLFGFVLFAPAAIMFLLALQLGSEGSHEWNSAVIIGLLCGSGVNAIVFIAWEWYMGDRAMIPGSMIKQRIVWCSGVANTCLMSSLTTGAYYLPIYFQAVKGASPSMSGVYTLPSILSQLIAAVVSGAGVSKLGYYLPWTVFGTALCAIGSGLISMWNASTTTSEWIGYQVVAGIGRGATMQMATVAIQNAVPQEQIPVSLAFLIFAQNLGSSVAMVIASTIFNRSLVSEVKSRVPSINPQRVLDAGGVASAVRGLVSSNDLPGLLQAYSVSISRAWYLLSGISVLAFCAAWGMGWKDVRTNMKKTEESENAGKEKV